MEFETLFVILTILQEYILQLASILENSQTILLLVGLPLLLAGWRFYWIIYTLPGWVLGGMAGYTIGMVGDDAFVGFILGGVGLLAGWFIFGLAHGILVWGSGFLLALSAFASLDLEATGFIVFLAFIGSILFVIVYNLLKPIVAALIGAVMLSGIMGYGSELIPVVAAVGFFIQYSQAQRQGYNIFTLKKKPRRQDDTAPEPTPRRTRSQPGAMQYEEFEAFTIDDFDPNAEMPTVERKWR
ncbi:MAG: hypothetical protein ACLFTK_15520 [Anaerolineales bacterium]